MNTSPRGRVPAPGLHIVATPLGHADDITLRALDTLEAADLVVCEDTRVTARLFAIYGLSRPMLAYHDHNGAKMRPRILDALDRGAVVALVSDAGTPLVSDPGYRLVEAVLEAGHGVFPVPGPSAPLAALCVAGLPTDRFLFAGFAPTKDKARRETFQELSAVPATLIFFETGPRAAACLEVMAQVFGPRPAALARELTKTYEQVRRAPLDVLARSVAEQPPKGELVILIGPPSPAREPDQASLDAALQEALARLPLKAAVAEVTAALGLPRRQVYQRALGLRDGSGDVGP